MNRILTFETGSRMYHTGVSYANQNVLTAGSRGRVLGAIKYLDNPTGDNYTVEENKDRGKAAVHGFYKGMPVTIFSSGEGTGSVSCTFPEIVEACNSKKMNVIRIGTSGGYKSDMKVGDFVVTTSIDAGDNTHKYPIDLMFEIARLYKEGNWCGLGYHEKVVDLVDRASKQFNSPEDMIVALSERGAHGYEYHPRTDEKITMAVIEAVKENKLDVQNFFVGKTGVTPDIFSNIILKTIRPEKEALAVSMEISVLCGYRDFYNIIDGRDIMVGNLLMISDLVGAEADNMGEFLANSAAYEEAHIRVGLEALLKMSNR